MKKGIGLLLALVISGCATTAPTNSKFMLEIVPIQGEGQTRHVKYNRATGETWWSANTTWVRIKDEEPLPPSLYQVKIVATGESWRAVRIDTASGKTWKNSRGTWVPFTEKVEQ